MKTSPEAMKVSRIYIPNYAAREPGKHSSNFMYIDTSSNSVKRHSSSILLEKEDIKYKENSTTDITDATQLTMPSITRRTSAIDNFKSSFFSSGPLKLSFRDYSEEEPSSFVYTTSIQSSLPNSSSSSSYRAKELATFLAT